MTVLVGYLLLFLVVAVGFVFVHLVMGRFIRPVKPSPEKLTIYECGEPTIGSAWIQFDLRFYVVALLFVIFDVEVAFFFPWAVVFGQANTLASVEQAPAEARQAAYKQQVRDFLPPLPENRLARERYGLPPVTHQIAIAVAAQALASPAVAAPVFPQTTVALEVAALDASALASPPVTQAEAAANSTAARQFAWLGFFDLLVFFGVLLVGFAYLWKRGDLAWVRSTAAEGGLSGTAEAVPAKTEPRVLVGAGRD